MFDSDGGIQVAARDDIEPNALRQAELSEAYAKNIAEGKAPYEGVTLRSYGELLWIMAQRNWSGEPLAVNSGRPNLCGIDLSDVNLSGAYLFRANLSGAILIGTNLERADLFQANLTGANIMGANLSGANLYQADLSGADMYQTTLIAATLHLADLSAAGLWAANATDAFLYQASFRGAYLNRADLKGANLQEADLRDATLTRADLRAACLVGARLDEATILRGVILDRRTWLADVAWSGASLTHVELSQAPVLGDEAAIRESKALGRRHYIAACRDAARAYRGLSLALRTQGYLAQASRYRLREQRMERKALRKERRYISWLFSCILNLMCGYGERSARAFVAYMAVVLGFTGAYYGITHLFQTKLAELSWDQALVLSLTSFHGRGFFPGSLPLGDWVARAAAVEAVIGLFIELIFVASFSRRFLGN